MLEVRLIESYFFLLEILVPFSLCMGPVDYSEPQFFDAATSYKVARMNLSLIIHTYSTQFAYESTYWYYIN